MENGIEDVKPLLVDDAVVELDDEKPYFSRKRQRGERGQNDSYAWKKKNTFWSVKEKIQLIYALHTYGFSETKMIADALKTRTENEVKYFIQNGMVQVRQQILQDIKAQNRNRSVVSDVGDQIMEQPIKVEGRNKTLTAAELQFLPPLESWRQTAARVVSKVNKVPDYSNILVDLFRKVREAEKNVDDPDEFDFKAIYKYFEDVLNGWSPAKLRPIDSQLVQLLSLELGHICQDMSTEEFQFIKTFIQPTAFVPDLSTRNENVDSSNIDGNGEQQESVSEERTGGIAIPDYLHQELCRYLRVKENLNPLGVPVWLLKERQQRIAEIFRK